MTEPTLATNPRVGAISARQAAAEALATILREMRANADGGTDADRGIALERVETRWPHQGELAAPLAAITDVSIDPDDDDDERWLDESFDAELGMALKTTQTSGVFAVDLWARDDVERQAFEVAVEDVFRAQGNARVLVAPMPETALPRAWRGRGLQLPVQLTLRQQAAPIDDPGLVADDEYRAHFEVEWDALKVTAVPVDTLEVIARRGGVDAEEDEDDEDEED